MRNSLNAPFNTVVAQGRKTCREYFFSQTERLFFWEHTLTEIYQNDVFIKLPIYTESLAFCCISSALSMFALKNNPTARLVQADISIEKQTLRHGWVEFFYRGKWWVVDFTWTEANNNPTYQKIFNYWECPSNKWVCNYLKFWTHPTTKSLERFLLKPETSHIFNELYAYAGCQRRGGIEILGPKGSALVKDPEHGTLSPGRFPFYDVPDGNPLHPVCQIAINDLASGDRVTEQNLTKIEQFVQEFS